MTISTCLNKTSYYELLEIIPKHIETKPVSNFNPDDLMESDLIISEISHLPQEEMVASIAAKTMLIASEDDSMQDIVKAVQTGMQYLSLKNDEQTIRQFLLNGCRVKSIGKSDELPEMGIIGSSNTVMKIKEEILLFAPHDDTVCISGDTGTGKDLAARALHNYSRRKDGPFLAVNCAAVPVDLLESELFGVMKGAFTGAETSRKGYFEAAHKGTLFLDEIGDMPPVIQSKLLRVVEEKKVNPLGSTRSRNCDVRIIAATSKDLKDLVDTGQFRQDLFYRINTLQMKMPPLTKRKNDIPHLSLHFLAEYKKRLHPDALAKLMDHHWPGNIRELKATLRKATIKSESQKQIRRHHIEFL